jgi:hypothetical protein
LALYPDKATQDIGWPLDIPTIAAALRAAADQVMPEESRPTGMRPCGDTYSAREIRRAERMKLREQLLAIADELKTQ